MSFGGYYPRCASWGREKWPAAITIIASRFIIAPIGCTQKTADALMHKVNMTQKHIAQSGCRGPRPKE